MTNFVRTAVVVLGVTLAGALAGGCGDSKSTSDDVLAKDTTLNLDVAVAIEDSSLQDGQAGVVAAPQPSPLAGTSAARTTGESSASVASSRSVERAAPPRPSRRVARPTAARRSTRVAAQGATQGARAPRESGAQTATESAAAITSTNASRNERVAERAAVVRASSQVFLASEDRICAAGGNVGDRFSARLTEAVVATNGTVIPAGSAAVGEITSLEAGLDLRIESISFNGRTYPISSEVTYTEMELVRSRSRSADAGKIAGGAAVGAVLGQLLGRNVKSTVIGAAGGAVTGAVIANRTAAFDRCVPDGGRITARLTQPLAI